MRDADADPSRRPVAILEAGGRSGCSCSSAARSRGGTSCAAPDELFLRGFFVDAGEQGRGIATAALGLVRRFVRAHETGMRRVVLTVHVENEVAMRAYLRAGFADTGELDLTGRLGPQHVLELLT